MRPKEKAKELFDKMEEQQEGYYLDNKQNTKNCALVAVDEIIKILPQSEYLEDRGEYHENRELMYWQQVKQEIEKL